MQTVRLVKRTAADGSLSLQIPLGRQDMEVEVLIVMQPHATSTAGDMLEQRGWPPGYFEQTYGSIQDETFACPLEGFATSGRV